MKKRTMSKEMAEFRALRAENLLAMKKFVREQTQLMFYWTAVNNAVGKLKGRKLKRKRY